LRERKRGRVVENPVSFRFFDPNDPALTDPHKHVSYSLHNPYGKYPADGSRGAAFAVAADMSPWFLEGDVVPPRESMDGPLLMGEYWKNPDSDKGQVMRANSTHHGHEGQNVAFADGHWSYEKATDVGIRHDGIYTYWPKETEPTETERRIGTNPTGRGEGNDAKSPDDSFLAI
jgi:prepilin-type processing-associated H-X9-DG protein